MGCRSCGGPPGTNTGTFVTDYVVRDADGTIVADYATVIEARARAADLPGATWEPRQRWV